MLFKGDMAISKESSKGIVFVGAGALLLFAPEILEALAVLLPLLAV